MQRYFIRLISSAAAVLLVFAACDGQQGARLTPAGEAASSHTSATETVIHSFGGDSDGAVPWAGLVNLKGTLYGTTTLGGGTGPRCGTPGCGTIYRVTRDGNEDVVYNFTGLDGADPQGSLIAVKGELYGTTLFGGVANVGNIFRVTTAGTETVLHNFGGTPDGSSPYGSLIEVKGTLYGTTMRGGAYNNGTVFSVTQSGLEKVLYSFKGASYGDGEGPRAGLTEIGGELYGTTFYGGSGAGTVFKITRSGKERVLYRFAPYRHDAGSPGSTLVDINGTLYGTSWFGGSGYSGTVFSVTTSGQERVLHSFTGSPDGAEPYAGLTNVAGTLYGTTWVGGSIYGEDDEGVGTVFSVTPSGKERIVYRFGAPPDGALSAATLIYVNGTLFGTTASGGVNSFCPAAYAYGCGAIFAIPLK